MKGTLYGARTLRDSLSSQIYQKRSDIYSQDETVQLAMLLMEHFLGQPRTNILINKEIAVDKESDEQMAAAIERLNHGEPIQYITGEAYFYGLSFRVNPSVLIPRRETEELVNIITQENKHTHGIKALDIGTGSGCIAIYLQKMLTEARVVAWDISHKALELAQSNAKLHEAKVLFQHKDVLQYKGKQEEAFDIVVSNPPYVAESEAEDMKKNVLEYEPSLALFVKNDEPLIFYDKIAQLCMYEGLLKLGGKLYFEINEQYGKEVAAILTKYKFINVRCHQDMQGKERFVVGSKKL